MLHVIVVDGAQQVHSIMTLLSVVMCHCITVCLLGGSEVHRDVSPTCQLCEFEASNCSVFLISGPVRVFPVKAT